MLPTLKTPATILTLFLCVIGHTSAMSQASENHLEASTRQVKNLELPSSISAASKQAISLVYQAKTPRPAPQNATQWQALQERLELQFQSLFKKTILSTYTPTLSEIQLADIPALEITPKNWDGNKKRLVYFHGGAYTRFSPMSTLSSSVPVAHDLNLKTLAIDYSLAPKANFQQINDEALAVYRALLAKGHKPEDIILFGDSAGGGLVSTLSLRISQEKLPQPGALLLWSPWMDIGAHDDTMITLTASDPILESADIQAAALAFAPNKDDWKKPLVSPIYGDVTQFPPTLIQCGTREALLSQCVRLFQKLDDGSKRVKLDIYEGMPHVFQGFFFHIEEAVLARKKMKRFVESL